MAVVSLSLSTERMMFLTVFLIMLSGWFRNRMVCQAIGMLGYL